MAENFDKPKAKKEANLGLAKWLVIAEKWRSKITGKSPLLTKETIRNGTLQCNYVNEKIKKELNFEFIPVEKTIKETAKVFLSEH